MSGRLRIHVYGVAFMSLDPYQVVQNITSRHWQCQTWFPMYFSSPKPKAHGWANSIPVTLECVRHQSVNIFKHLLYLDSLGCRNMDLVIWPRWPTCPYMIKKKHFKSFFSRTEKAYDLGIWYVAFGMCGLPSVFKWKSYVDLGILNVKVEFAF